MHVKSTAFADGAEIPKQPPVGQHRYRFKLIGTYKRARPE
jgi:phosphatidylethanolamine-binding protein (PEBP) family uncharacterized protein